MESKHHTASSLSEKTERQLRNILHKSYEVTSGTSKMSKNQLILEVLINQANEVVYVHPKLRTSYYPEIFRETEIHDAHAVLTDIEDDSKVELVTLEELDEHYIPVTRMTSNEDEETVEDEEAVDEETVEDSTDQEVDVEENPIEESVEEEKVEEKPKKKKREKKSKDPIGPTKPTKTSLVREIVEEYISQNKQYTSGKIMQQLEARHNQTIHRSFCAAIINKVRNEKNV